MVGADDLASVVAEVDIVSEIGHLDERRLARSRRLGEPLDARLAATVLEEDPAFSGVALRLVPDLVVSQLVLVGRAILICSERCDRVPGVVWVFIGHQP